MRNLSPTVVALLALSLSACINFDPLPFAPASPAASPDPSLDGPFPVGVRTVTFLDASRPKSDGTPRKLVTEIWYPATHDARGQPGVDYDVRTLLTPEQQAAVAGGAFPLLHTSAVRDAEPSHRHGPYPLVVFSHGQGGMRWQSTYYTVKLASHGYIVVSPDHEGDTLAEAVRNQLETTVLGILERPADVIFLLNRMSALEESDPLYGLVDLNHIGVTGHSFGALTSLRVAPQDARIKALVAQAPPSIDIDWLGLKSTDLRGIPVMIQGSRLDHTLPWDDHVVPTWAKLTHPRWLVEIKQGGHFTFSDLCGMNLIALAGQIKLDIPGANVSNVLSDGCGPDATPAAEASAVIDAMAIGHFNAALRGDTKGLARLTQAGVDAVVPGVANVTADP